MAIEHPELGAVDVTRFHASIEKLRLDYASASPWPHVVIDDFLPNDIAQRTASAFPRESDVNSKLALIFGARSYRASVPQCPPVIDAVLAGLESPAFATFVAQITGIADLAADRTHAGSGFHQGARGSHLRIHADHNVHPVDGQRYRRVNLLIYLNNRWEQHWNGDLELWDRNARHCVKKISPKFNRCVIFGVDDTAYHGYGPLRMPFGETRNALAEYYYSDSPGAGQSAKAHGTELPRVAGETAITRVRYRVRSAILWRVKQAIQFLGGPRY